MPELALWQWSLGVLIAFFVGLAKAGVPGLGIAVVPLMILLVGDARKAAGWLLPMLCVADLFAVLYWRRHADWRHMFRLAPAVVAGMGLGAAALNASEQVLRPVVGVLVFVMLGIYLRRRFARAAGTAPLHPAPWGVVAGFATTVANAAGPVMNLYLLAKNMSKHEFMGTTAWFFFIINLGKTPIYASYGFFSAESLSFDAVLLPAVLAGSAAGRWVFLHTPQKVFEAVVVALTVIATLLLFR